MLTWLRRWRPRHLLASWIVYWVLLVAITLGKAILAAWRVTHLPDGHGNISAGFSDGIFNLVIAESGKTVWQGSASLLSIALLVAGPPLVLWLLWILAQRRQPVGASETVGSPGQSRTNRKKAGARN